MSSSTIIFIGLMTVLINVSTAIKPISTSNILGKAPLPNVRADPSKYRLPGTTTPSNYTVVLKVDLNKRESFSGNIAINIIAQVETDEIVLHSNLLTINNIIVKSSTGNVDLYKNHSLSTDDTQFLRIQLNETLVVNQQYVITIDFLGKYGDNYRGLFLTSYTNRNGTIRYLASTQFEPVSAREAFPCYDEPALKAIFQINIYAPEGYHAISNTDQMNDTALRLKPLIQDGLKLFAFEPTALMSPYLVAFVISDFVYKSNEEQTSRVFSKKFRVFSRPNAVDNINFFFEIGEKSIVYLEKYTNVTYALSKFDNIAIPKPGYGAMENWGLVTFSESALLNIPCVTTTAGLQRVVTTQTHEYAHMWFGDEVSPLWWNYVWLNEGFATYFQYYASDKIAPEWRIVDQFAIRTVHVAMLPDALESTNAMSSSVSSPQEIDNNLNFIAYQKSGSVIRMMAHILGEQVFQQGLRNYLKSIPRGVAEPEILFAGIQAAADGKGLFPENVTVSDVFGSWSNQPGFPVVIAKKSNDNNYIELTQERFFQNPTVSSSEKWWIPITWVTSKGGNFENTSVQQWLNPRVNPSIISMDLKDNDWYILNKQQTGYYRVKYDDTNWKLLSNALKAQNFSGIHLLNRAQLIDDSLELAKASRISYNITFNLLNYLREEIDFIAWMTVDTGISFLNVMMPATSNYNLYKEYVRRLSNKMYDIVGFEPKENDDYVTRMSREIITDIACSVENKNCLEKSKEKLESLVENYDMKIDPDMSYTIYRYGMRNASLETWKFFWSKYINTTSNTEKETILETLACSENENIIKNYLSMSITEESLTPHHRYIILNSVIDSGPIGLQHAVQFVTKNFTAIQSKMTLNTVNIINDLRDKIVTKENSLQFENFVHQYEGFNTTEKEAANAALSEILKKRVWIESVLKDIDPWLVENVVRTNFTTIRNSVDIKNTSITMSFLSFLALCIKKLMYVV